MPGRTPAISLALLILSSSLAPADTLTGRVTRVIDGDTIMVGTNRIRLADIDAPELSQPHGPEAKATLAAMVLDREVVVQYTRRDRYRRMLATVHLENQKINCALVAAGHAWRYRYARNRREPSVGYRERGTW